MAKKNKTYPNVTELVRDVSEDKSFADDFEKHVAERFIAKTLLGLRAELGISQKEIADSMQCTQSRVSKLENSTDTQLRLGDVDEYLKALGLELHIIMQPTSWTAVDEVKYHAFEMKKDLDGIVKLAHGDEKIVEGVRNFWAEAFVNVLGMLTDCGKNLPPARPRRIGVEVQRNALMPNPKRSNGSAKESAPA